MAKKEVTFPTGVREGENFSTPQGMVTVGPGGKAKVTDDQHAHLGGDEYFSQKREDSVDTQREHSQRLAMEAAATSAYQVSALEPSVEYENAASAREAAGKYVQRHGHTLLEEAQAKAQASADNRDVPADPLKDTGLATVDLGDGRVTHGGSAALRVKAERAVARERFEAGEAVSQRDVEEGGPDAPAGLTAGLNTAALNVKNDEEAQIRDHRVQP